MENHLAELRQYRELRRRRDLLIIRAAKAGRSQRQIAKASGLSLRRVQQVLGSNNFDLSSSKTVDDLAAG